MNRFRLFIVTSAENPHLPYLRRRSVGHGSILSQQSHRYSDNCPAVSRCGDTPRDSPGDVAGPSSTSVHPPNGRLRWDERLHRTAVQRSSTKVHIPFSSQQDEPYVRYAPYVHELLKSLWSLDHNPIWLLVDQLVAIGEPLKISDTCPEFPQWKHVVDGPSFSDAVASLVAQGHLREPQLAEDGDDEPVETARTDPVPTWLVAFMLATKTTTRAAAHEGLAFCLSQLDHTPSHLRASLLLLSMCSLSAHGLAPHVSVLLGSFHDVFSLNEATLADPEGERPGSEATRPPGSQETIIYQYNVLLTLLSQFPHVPRFSMRVGQLLRHMETCGIPIENGTANQLITARFASASLVHTVRDVLEKQEVVKDHAEQSDELSVPMTRFYSKRVNPKEVEKYIDASRRVNPLKHVQTYLLSFRDAAASLSYLRTIEAQRVRDPRRTASQTQKEAAHASDTEGSSKNGQSQGSASPPKSVPMRHIYTSMLYSAAVSKTISVSTFRDLFDSIRATHGDDRVLETVALTGMLKRQAWDAAKDLWNQWQAENQGLRTKHHEMREYFDRRERIFGDAEDVQQALGWTHLRGYLLWRTIKRMKVDATALAVAVRALAGCDTSGLLEAFDVMDGFALKVGNTDSTSSADSGDSAPRASKRVFPRTVHSPQTFRPQDVRLTSRVINCFMTRSLQLRRPDVVFRLWDGMTTYYGVDTSVATLDILLRSARVATSMESTLSKVVPHWLNKGTSRDFLRNKVAFPDLSEEIRWMLGPDCAPGMRWDGAPAWRIARRVFREEILFANWPALRNVQVPAQAVRGDEAMGRIEAFKEFTMDQGLWGTQVRKMGNYPHLVPGPRTFREYVILLGRVQRSSEIPEVLAWMKALDVRPSRRTLSICLALWAQVGLGSPLDDVWVEPASEQGSEHSGHASAGGEVRHGGEYSKLITWLEDWMGKDEVPGDAEALDSLRYIRELEEAEAIRD